MFTTARMFVLTHVYTECSKELLDELVRIRIKSKTLFSLILKIFTDKRKNEIVSRYCSIIINYFFFNLLVVNNISRRRERLVSPPRQVPNNRYFSNQNCLFDATRAKIVHVCTPRRADRCRYSDDTQSRACSKAQLGLFCVFDYKSTRRLVKLPRNRRQDPTVWVFKEHVIPNTGNTPRYIYNTFMITFCDKTITEQQYVNQ